MKSLKTATLIKNFPTINNPKATAGPIPKANNNVPTPTFPPRYQPNRNNCNFKKCSNSCYW